MKKVLLVLVIVAIGAFIYTKSNEPKIEGVKKITLIQAFDHQAIVDSWQGVRNGLAKEGLTEGKDVILSFENGNGDNATLQAIAQKVSREDADLIVPWGTGSSQAILNLVKDRPIVFAAVTDPKSAGLVSDPEHPGANITGTSDITLYKESLELLKKILPNAKKVGVLHNPGEANSVFALAETKKYAAEMGLELVVAPVNSSADVYQAAKSISSKVDALYELPDNTVIAGSAGFIKASLEDKKPLIGLIESDVKGGALAALSTSYVKVGERTAEIIVRVLKGEKPGDIPVLGVTDADVFVNKKTSETIGVAIPEEVLKSAKTVF